MKDGYDGAGIPISRSGPQSAPPSSSAGTAWDSRGISISRSTCNNDDLKKGTSKSADVQRSGGNW